MLLKHEDMLERFMTRDKDGNGRFVVGVVTTGIYCLPTCTARKPKPENVRFFPGLEEARSAGLRPCKRCRPEDFYADYDPHRELVIELADRVRARPSDFGSVGAMAKFSGIGATKLNALVRRYYHSTPAALLNDARIEHATRALHRSDKRILEVALEAGFESSSAFHENFARRAAMSPGAYRALRKASEFSMRLPDRWRCDEVLSVCARSGSGGSERVIGSGLAKGMVLAGRPVRLDLRISKTRVRCTVSARGRIGAAVMAEAHRVVLRLLGLNVDPEAFVRAMRRAPGGRRLIAGGEGVRIPLTFDIFEGLVWVIVGQQVNLTFASTCRDVLVELCGADLGDGLRTHPTPEAVAELKPEALTARQFSRRKAEYMIDSARAVANGELDLERLRTETADAVRDRLQAVRGLGPWSVNYLMMRSFGFADCVPVGDAGLVHSLATFHGLERRPNPKETLELMEPFAPYRSYASYHFWRRLGESE